MRKFERVYHPYEQWEEIAHNMWGDVVDRAEYLERAIIFTGNHVQYGHYMMRVINEWPISCENALTDYALSKKAWIGHAACALALGCPEDITRLAWGYLTDEQQFLANQAAERAIQEWSVRYAKSKGILREMGSALLSIWDTGRGDNAADELLPRAIV